jgi:hypothetical protein
MPEIFPVALRNPGVFGPTNPIALGTGPAGKTYEVKAEIAQADLDDPTVKFTIEMQIQLPDLTWPTTPNAAVSFVGGPNRGKGGTATPAPGFRVNGDDVANRSVRFRLNNTGRAVNLGLTADPV